MDPDFPIVIWSLPYEAPQEALGYFDIAEACELLRKPDLEIEWALDRYGFIEANGFRAELNA